MCGQKGPLWDTPGTPQLPQQGLLFSFPPFYFNLLFSLEREVAGVEGRYKGTRDRKMSGKGVHGVKVTKINKNLQKGPKLKKKQIVGYSLSHLNFQFNF